MSVHRAAVPDAIDQGARTASARDSETGVHTTKSAEVKGHESSNRMEQKAQFTMWQIVAGVLSIVLFDMLYAHFAGVR